MSNNLPGNPSINPHLPIPHFRYFCQKVLPAVYDDSLSYYELLCKLTAKINEVIVANEDELGAIKELQDLYVELKNYIDSYFKNLDLQKEIDIKLDEMGANGELSEYISMYLSTLSTFAFKNVAEMKNADTIGLGAVCRTLGTTDYKIGDGHYYIVRRALTTDVFDDVNLVVLKNPELVAERIPNYFDNDLMDKINSNTQKIDELEDSINQTNINLGDLNELTTNSHDSCVSAINTINTGLSDLSNRVVPVSLGGTGATDTAQALSNLGASPVTHNHSASDLNSGVLPINRGGTGATTSEEARTNLEVMKAHILYHNDLGSEGTIILSDDVNNYEFIDIIAWDFVLTRIYELNNRPVALIRMGGWGDNYMEWFSESITLTGNSITRNGCTWLQASENGTMTFDYSRKIPIRSVIGYK